jgi:catechol 2,3-dioxygenase-like lactoylglutathione lyase family enzyme
MTGSSPIGANSVVPMPNAPAASAATRYDSAEVATLRLGEETLHLVRPNRLGRAYPEPQAANDPWFQHFAIAVSDAAAAFERLSRMPFTPISRGGPIQLPPSSGSVIAYKFRDPDGHPLELSQFPDDRWTRRRTAPGPFTARNPDERLWGGSGEL